MSNPPSETGAYILLRLIEVLGTCAVVGIRKALPAISKKLNTTDEGAFVTARGGVQMKDVINLIDVSSNPVPIPNRFTWNANGRCGIDFVYFLFPHAMLVKNKYPLSKFYSK
jgi:hypothetical protein